MSVRPLPARGRRALRSGRSAEPGVEPELPSGRQLRLVLGDQEVVVTEVGATLRAYAVGGEPVVDGFPEDETCADGRGQLLLPWPNRLRDGRYSFGGAEHQLPLNEPGLGTAIHGLTRWSNWVAEPQSETRLAMRHMLHSRPGYPFILDLTALYELDPSGLTVSISAVNRGSGPAPFGAGAHPYVRCGSGPVDGWRLRIPAAVFLLSDSRLLPTGRAGVAGRDRDFRRTRAIASTRLDTAYTDLIRDPDGRARVTLEAVDGRRLAVWLDEAYRWVQVFTGDTHPRVQDRRRSLAVEPMTCPPDAFRSGADLIVLEPGETLTARWGIDISGFRG